MSLSQLESIQVSPKIRKFKVHGLPLCFMRDQHSYLHSLAGRNPKRILTFMN